MINLESFKFKFDNLENFYINKNCGYFLIENQKENIKFPKRFLEKDEIQIINQNLSEIDKKISDLCGPIGSHPEKTKFKEILFLRGLQHSKNSKNLHRKCFPLKSLRLTSMIFLNVENGLIKFLCVLQSCKIIGVPTIAMVSFMSNAELKPSKKMMINNACLPVLV